MRRRKMLYKKTFPILLLFVVLLFTSCGGGKEVKPNILLITIDTLRTDHLGAYGYYRETSPFIDRLAKKGLMFKHVITPIPLTAGSHASILTSLHPVTHNVMMNGTRLDDKVQTMAEVLKENGYYTIGAVAVALLKSSKNFSQGFDSFSDEWEKDPKLDTKFPLAERVGESVNKSLFSQIDEYLANPGHKDKPVFIWVHYFDPHYPYYSRENITIKTDLREGHVKGLNKYDKEIRYTDECIKELYEYLEQKGLARRMVTCVTSDHGEQFGEHGYTYGHADFYSENTFVPLIFNGYRIPENKVIDNYVSTMDIAVTLLGMVDLKFAQLTEGIDLLKRDNKSKPKTYPYPARKFLIMGNPMYSRSLQLLGYPFSYIFNFDYHYRSWFISGQIPICKNEKRFKPIDEKQVTRKDDRLIISLPYKPVKGLNYAILRADIKENKNLSVSINVLPYLHTGSQSVSPKINKHLNIIYPVTALDSLKITLAYENKNQVDNLKYALIPAKELLKTTPFEQEIENKIYNDLLTLRKKKKQDELFDLANDFKMEKNLVKVKKFKPLIIRSRKIIYDVFNYYYQKKNKLLKGIKIKELTGEDKKILESLGYL